MMKKLLLLTSLFGLFFLFATSPAQAASCSTVGECVDGHKCIYLYGNLVASGESCGDAAGQSVVGPVRPPAAILSFNRAANGNSTTGIGLVIFLSRALRLFTIVVGLFVIANVLLAAYDYITNADSSDVMTKVKEKFTYTALGLAIIVGAYTLAAIVGLLFFGDAGFILSPTLTSALDM